MSGIYETNSSFQFDKLLLSSPKLIAGGIISSNTP